MIKTIDYYLNLPYTRELIPEPGGNWFVRIKELPNCISQGETPEEALRMIDDAMRGWLSIELEDGEQIPEPRDDEEYSGKFNTRIPKSLHRKLVETADREGVSLNQWINTALAVAVGERTARQTRKPDNSEESPAPNQWPGLSDAIRQVLQDVGKGYEADDIDEHLFAGWLDQNLNDIQMDRDKRSFDHALEKTRALYALLSEYRQRSPILQSIFQFVVEISHLHEVALDMNQKVAQAEVMREQISSIVGVVNLPIQSRVQGIERNRFSIATSTREPAFIDKSKPQSEW